MLPGTGIVAHDKSKELNGFPSSSTTNGVNRPVNLDPAPYDWQRPAQTIPSPMPFNSHNPAKPNKVHNPFNHSRQSFARHNHVASKTVTQIANLPGSKRRKTEHPQTMAESKYWPKQHGDSYHYYAEADAKTMNARNSINLAAPSRNSVREKISVFEGVNARNGGDSQGLAGSHSSSKAKSPNLPRFAPFPAGTNGTSLHASTFYEPIDEPIDVDDDMGVPVPGPSRLVDISPKANAREPPQAHKRLNVPEPNENHAFCQKETRETPRQSSLDEYSTRPQHSSNNKIARDGNSALRLREKLFAQNHSLQGSSSVPRRVDASEASRREGSAIQPLNVDSDLDENEGVSDTREINPSTEPKAVPNTTRRTDKGFATAGAQLPFKPPSAAKEIDLRKMMTNTRKSQKMKLKGKQSTSVYKARTSKTASTPAISRHVVSRIPVLACVWGHDIIDYGEETDDHSLWDTAKAHRYWLYWEREPPQLYLALCNGEDSERRNLHMDNIKGFDIVICYTASFPFVCMDFSSQHRLPDEIRDVGICFKFVSSHPESGLGFADFRGFLIEVAGADADVVLEHGARACFNMKAQCATAALVKNVNQGGSKNQRTDGKAASQRRHRLPFDGDDDRNIRTPPSRTLRQSAKRQNSEEVQEEQVSLLAAKDLRQSTRLQEKEKEDPPENSNEVILVYPPSGSGGVHVTRSDLARLREEEFLNDTLIELGFKFWMQDMRTENPELADQVHIFSPFFFKKLSNKANKNPEDQHRSVQKWTTKVDIFQKKFIVVPVNENFHWYVMIVYQPAFILDPAPPKPPPAPTRSSQRKRSHSEKKMAMDVEVMDYENSKADGTEAIPPDIPSDGDERIVETELQISDAEAQLEACSLEARASRVSLERELSTSGDDFPPTISQLSTRGLRPEAEVLNLTDDEECESGRMEGGGPSRKGFEHDSEVELVDDSLDEDEDDNSRGHKTEDNVWRRAAIAADHFQNPSKLFNDSNLESRQDLDARTSHANDSGEGSGNSTFDDQPSKQRKQAEEHIQAGSPMLEDDINSFEVSEPVTSRTDIDDVAQGSTPIDTGTFYGSSSRPRTYGSTKVSKPNMGNSSDDDNDELDLFNDSRPRKPIKRRPQQEPIEIDITEFPLEPRRTYVFSLDSMTTAHPKACTKISNYLMNEAKARKNVPNPSEAVSKKLHVSAQPNFSDCGLYLLHLTNIFVSDADRLARLCGVSAQKKARLAQLWKDEKVKTMRAEMRERILRESEVWLKEKAEKEGKAVSAEKDATAGVSAQDPDRETTERDEAQTSKTLLAQAPGKVESDDELEVSEVHYVNGRGPRNRAQAKKPNRRASTRLR